jgi:hypothetical protein
MTMHVYKFVDDYGPQFFAARNLEEAEVEYAAMCEADGLTAPGRELTEAELDFLKVDEVDEDDALTGKQITVRQHLTNCTASDPDEAAFYLCGVDV